MSKELLLGLQTYAIRNFLLETDAAGTEKIVASLASMGYRTMEMGIDDFTPTPLEMKKILAAHGLSLCAVHVMMTELDKRYDETVQQFRDMGCNQLVFRARPLLETDIPRYVDKVAYYARRLQADGLQMHYHNHVSEFVRMADGSTMMARMLSLAKDGLFSIEADVAWLQIAGWNPARFIADMPAKVSIVHLRDVTANPDFTNSAFTVRPGAGNLDWPSILAACRARGVQYYIAEYNPVENGLVQASLIPPKFLPLLS